MSKPNLLLATSTFNENQDKRLDRIIKKKFNPIYNPYKRKLTEKELMQLLVNNKINYVVAGLESYNKKILKNTELKIISRLGSGVSNIDIKSAKSKKVKVFSIPHGPVDAVAELTLGMMITLLREVINLNNKMHKNIWKRENGNLLFKKNILIIGYGRIGKKLKKLLEPFKANIIIYDKIKKYKKNVNYMPLKKALLKADIITFHTDTEREILGKSEFKLLKKGVIICNTSRGSVINEKEIIAYVEKKIIRKIWLDVFNYEPYSGGMSKYENIIMTPHIGSYTEETRKKMELKAIQNIIKHI
jgi:D-3-phosphoglycerate dehydrogenase